MVYNLAAIENIDLVLTKGDSQKFYIEVADEYGIAVDITGWTVYFTVKTNLDVSDDNATIKKTITSHTDPEQGITEIVLSPTDTAHEGNYIYDIQIKTDDGYVRTVVQGLINFKKDVTQRS